MSESIKRDDRDDFDPELLDDTCPSTWDRNSEAWWPIATAPKDGLPILLWMGKYMAIGGWAPFLKEWTMCGENYDDVVIENRWTYLKPTHWRRLPKIPLVLFNWWHDDGIGSGC